MLIGQRRLPTVNGLEGDLVITGRRRNGETFARRISPDVVHVDLSANSLVDLDLTVLGSCKNLRHLTIFANQLTTLDLAPLTECSELDTLILEENFLESLDLSPLSNCPRLRILHLHRNQLSSLDLSPLKNTNIREIRLEGNPITHLDLSPLKNTTVEKIYLDSRFHDANREYIFLSEQSKLRLLIQLVQVFVIFAWIMSLTFIVQLWSG